MGCGNLTKQITTRETISNKKVQTSYYKDQLTENELQAYVKIVEKAEQIDTEDIILEDSISEYELARLSEAIDAGRPDLFYLYAIGGVELGSVINPSDDKLIDEYRKSDKLSRIKIEYIWDSKEEIEVAINQLDKKVNAITQRVMTGENLIGAEKYLRNQVLETTKIDMEFIEKYGGEYRGNPDKRDFLSMKAYGALVEQKASCGGYTSAYSFLLNEIGIESTGVVVLLNGGAHICNIIKINDKYVVVDLANLTYSVFNKEFSELNSNAAKYELNSLFEHDLE